MRKFILLLILIAAPAAALLAQPDTYVMRVQTDMYIPNGGVISLWGDTDSLTTGGGLAFGDDAGADGSINCGGLIYTRGDVDNRNQNRNPFVLAQPPELEEGTLRMVGTENEFIRGREITFFNLQVFNSKKILADNDAFVDVVDTFTIGESVEFSTETHQMVIQNSDTAAVRPLHPDNAFVSSTGDPDLDFNPNTEGGRLVWRTQNNPGVIYRFPVGAAGLPNFPRRDVEIATTTPDERHILARCVAKDPNIDGWEVNEDEDSIVCYTNERYYHIVDMQQPRGVIEDGIRFETTAHLAIRYAEGDGEFDALGHYDRIEPGELLVIGWQDTEAELEDKLVGGQAQSYGTVVGWDNYESPVFAFIARKPIRGIFTDVARSTNPLYYGDRDTPGQIIVSLDSLLNFFTDEQNTDKFDYNWTLTDQLPPNEVIWTSSQRHPEDVLSQGEFFPGYYDLNLTITNPAAPTACRAESNLLVLLKPSRVYYLPDAFSPNGDDVNQTFYAYFYGFEQAKIQIFNRWGVMIHDATFAPNEAIEGPERVDLWDGVDQGSGQPCPEGVYVFKLEVVSNDPNALRNKVWEETGTVTLIR